MRLESSGIVKEILINEDLLHPDKESISVCYRGRNSSGIIDFTPGELEEIYNSVRKRVHLIKGFRKFPVQKDELF